MGYSISTELSIYLPTKKADLDPEINHFITYLGDKSKFSKKIGYLETEVPRLNWGFKDIRSLRYELVTLKNSGFKLILDEVSGNCKGSRGYGLEYLPVRIIHEDLKDYQYPIYVCVSINHLLKTLIGSGYMSGGEIHGVYCMDSSSQANSYWRYCYPVLDDRISLEEPKRIAKVMSENKRMNCTRWIPGHKYIISAESFAVCLGKISDYLYFGRAYNYDRLTVLLKNGLTTWWGGINCENDGTLIYFGSLEEIEKIKGKTVSMIIKEYLSDKDSLISYWQWRGLCICRKMNSGYYGWEDGDYVMNDILDEKSGIRDLVQEKCTEYFMGLDIGKDEELALVYMTGLGNDLISSNPAMKEKVMKIAEKNIENTISNYNKNSSFYYKPLKLEKDTDPDQVLASNRGDLRTIRNFRNNFGLSDDEIKEMIKKVLAKL